MAQTRRKSKLQPRHPLGRLNGQWRRLALACMALGVGLGACSGGANVAHPQLSQPGGHLWQPGVFETKVGSVGDMKGAGNVSLGIYPAELKQYFCDQIQTAVPGQLVCLQGDACGRLSVWFSSVQMQWACTHCDQAKAGVGMPKYSAYAYVAVQDGCTHVAEFEWREMGDSEEELARHCVSAFVKAFKEANT
jgi:hypothetical protein